MTTNTAAQFLKSLQPALPLSPIKTSTGGYQPMSNGDIRRLCEQKGVLINGETVQPFELIDFPVFSIVFYPKSEKKRTTIL